MVIKTILLPSVATNCYVVADENTKHCAIIDPGAADPHILETVGGSLLVVSQFTLYADTKSRRPGFTGAARPDVAIPLYEYFMDQCAARGFHVEHGEFGADMQVYSQNDGPVTIVFDTDQM